MRSAWRDDDQLSRTIAAQCGVLEFSLRVAKSPGRRLGTGAIRMRGRPMILWGPWTPAPQ